MTISGPGWNCRYRSSRTARRCLTPITTPPSAAADSVTGNTKEAWADEVFISTGLMTVERDSNGNITSAKKKKKGHNYTFQEIEDGHYYWDLDVETVRPMLINEIVDGVEKSVLKTFVNAYFPRRENENYFDLYSAQRSKLNEFSNNILTMYKV